MRTLGLLFLLALMLHARQLLVVVSDDFDSSRARLFCVENGAFVCRDVPVVLGSNGLGWGVYEDPLPHKAGEAQKQEGDMRSPAGIFSLDLAFGYAPEAKTKMPYIQAKGSTLCIDDPDSLHYNEIVQSRGDAKSFERLLREDDLYIYALVVGHNKAKIPKRGSCIFLHKWRSDHSTTAGCTAMALSELKMVLSWLDPAKKPLLIQVPKSYLPEVKKRFPSLNKLTFSR